VSVFQSHAIALRLNFGGGLIPQSESQNVLAGEVTHAQKESVVGFLCGQEVGTSS
jgi:hypothetical protein